MCECTLGHGHQWPLVVLTIYHVFHKGSPNLISLVIIKIMVRMFHWNNIDSWPSFHNTSSWHVDAMDWHCCQIRLLLWQQVKTKIVYSQLHLESTCILFEIIQQVEAVILCNQNTIYRETPPVRSTTPLTQWDHLTLCHGTVIVIPPPISY